MASVSRHANGRWRARYYDDAGRQHARHFARKVDAQRWLDEVTAAIVTGQYVDPGAGRTTFREYAEQWRLAQVHRQSSAAHVETMLRRHAYPTLGDRRLSAILPSEVQAWVKALVTGDETAKRKPLAPSTVGVVHGLVSSVFKAAVRDRKVLANPCEGTRLPTPETARIVPLTTEQVEALRDAAPDPLRALVMFAAQTGLRQGEVFGVTTDRIDWLRREVRVDRQLVTRAGNVTEFAPPKTKASIRTVPLPTALLEVLGPHVEEFGPGPDGLLFHLDGEPLRRQAFGHLWRPMADAVGLEKGTGMHALRHYYASLLIRYGESVKTVQARLGHASAAETLDTYSHLWPDSDDRTRAAIDSVWLARGASAAEDNLRTAGES